MDALVLFGLCVLGIILGAMQNGARAAQKPDLVGAAVRLLVEPIAIPISTITRGSSDFLHGILHAHKLSEENRMLKAEADTFALYAEQIESKDKEIETLRTLAGFGPVPGKKRVPAQVIGLSINENRLTLDAGSRQGVKLGCPVESAEGLVGTVEEVEKNQCQVLLLTSAGLQPTSNGKSVLIGAMDASRKPSYLGLLKGENANTLILTFFDPKAPVQIGDLIVTPGISDKIPKGLQIGRIIQIEQNDEFGTLRARIDPAFSAGNLDLVFVLV